MKNILSILSLVAVIAFASSAHADDETFHQGFQFRYAGGVGYLNANESGAGQASDKVSGVSFEDSVYLGGSLVPGLFLGGMMENHYVSNPDLAVSGRQVNTASGAYLDLFSVGPYLDWYPNPNNGFHLLGSTGLSILAVGSDATSINGNGFNVGGGIGYDWRSGRNWNVGLLAKATYSVTQLSSGRVSSSENTITPALMLSISYH